MKNRIALILLAVLASGCVSVDRGNNETSITQNPQNTSELNTSQFKSNESTFNSSNYLENLEDSGKIDIISLDHIESRINEDSNEKIYLEIRAKTSFSESEERFFKANGFQLSEYKGNKSEKKVYMTAPLKDLDLLTESEKVTSIQVPMNGPT